MRFGIAILLTLFGKLLIAQPFINSVDPIVAGVGETVTLVGSGFSTTIADNQVYLGAGKATITSATDNTLTVQVPANATHGPIIYTNLSNDLSASHSQFFGYSFGTTSFSASNLAAPIDTPTDELETYDVCSCDFDGDGDNDVVVTNNEFPASAVEDAVLLLYENTSTPGAVSFSGPTRLGNLPTIKVTCLDLSADGFPDIVATEGANNNDEVFVFENTGSGSISTSFNATPTVILILPRDDDNQVRGPEVVQSADMDGDGLLDLVIGNRSENSREIDIFLNNTSSGSLSFATTPFQLQGPSGTASLRGIALGDLNGDNTPELVITEKQSNDIYVYRNESLSGNLRFGGPTTISPPGSNLQNVVLADFNTDGLLDIAASDVQLSQDNGNLILVENTTSTSGAQPTFEAPQTVSTLAQSWGIAAGDIDGDGDADVVIASEDPSANALNVIINNTTSGATLAASDFAVSTISLNFNSRNIVITDINGDAKSDLLFTSNSRSGQDGFMSVIVNNNCVIPSITPDSDVFCNGTTFEIQAVNSAASSYKWEVDSGSGFAEDAASTTSTFDISTYNTDISVRVTLETTDLTCSETSAAANFTSRAIATSTPTITSATSICTDADLVLSTSASATNYHWTGPNGFETVATSSSLVISNAQPVNAGTYQLQTEDDGNCKSQIASITIAVLPVPVLTVVNDGADVFCEGESTTLEVRNLSGVTYQWQRDQSDISGATSNTVTADATGDYRVVVTQGSCDRPSVAASITEVAPPSSVITSADEICVDVALTVQSSSTGDSAFTLAEQWEFFDGSGSSVGTATGTTASFAYTSAGNSSTRLTVEYVELPGCQDEASKTITVSDTPSIPIQTPDGNQKCPSDSLALRVDSTHLSYDWVDISSGSPDTLFQYTDRATAYLNTTGGRSTATVELTVLTSIGCLAKDTTTIEDFANSGISILSDEDIVNGVITIEMTNGVELRASNGSDFLWEPREIFTDSTGSQTKAFPRTATTDVTLRATDVNGCLETAGVTLSIPEILPRTGFSPNQDGLGYECWEILNSSTISGCKVFIFDTRGRNIVEKESPFMDDCVWDGTANGAASPEGVYYFVLQCESDSLSTSGSILLAR